MVVDDEGHDANVDHADSIGQWIDVDPACPVGGEGEGPKVRLSPGRRPPEAEEDPI